MSFINQNPQTKTNTQKHTKTDAGNRHTPNAGGFNSAMAALKRGERSELVGKLEAGFQWLWRKIEGFLSAFCMGLLEKVHMSHEPLSGFLGRAPREQTPLSPTICGHLIQAGLALCGLWDQPCLGRRFSRWAMAPCAVRRESLGVDGTGARAPAGAGQAVDRFLHVRMRSRIKVT